MFSDQKMSFDKQVAVIRPSCSLYFCTYGGFGTTRIKLPCDSNAGEFHRRDWRLKQTETEELGSRMGSVLIYKDDSWQLGTRNKLPFLFSNGGKLKPVYIDFGVI